MNCAALTLNELDKVQKHQSGARGQKDLYLGHCNVSWLMWSLQNGVGELEDLAVGCMVQGLGRGS